MIDTEDPGDDWDADYGMSGSGRAVTSVTVTKMKTSEERRVELAIRRRRARERLERQRNSPLAFMVDRDLAKKDN